MLALCSAIPAFASDDLRIDERVQGLAYIQAATQFCEFAVSAEALTSFVRSEGLDTLAALNAVQSSAMIHGLNMGSKEAEWPMMCAQAKATADAIGILAE